MITHDDDVDISDVLDRVKTGVNAFDELVMGGLPRGRTTVVGGTPGSGGSATSVVPSTTPMNVTGALSSPPRDG